MIVYEMRTVWMKGSESVQSLDHPKHHDPPKIRSNQSKVPVSVVGLIQPSLPRLSASAKPHLTTPNQSHQHFQHILPHQVPDPPPSE